MYFDLSKLAQIESLNLGKFGSGKGKFLAGGYIRLTNPAGGVFLIQRGFWQNEQQLFETVASAAVTANVAIDERSRKALGTAITYT
jgi:hypothetical protein